MAPKKAKSKLKKMLSPQTSPPQADLVDDDALMDDLMAQLDSRDQTVCRETATVLQEMQVNQAAEELDSAPKKDSKARFKARQARLLLCLCHPLSVFTMELQARKAAVLADNYAPNDPEADARIERQAKEEEANIKRMCEELGLTMHEVCLSLPGLF